MRSLIIDKKLHDLLDQLEIYFGYTISLVAMPTDHRNLSRCTIHLPQDGKWELWYIPKENLSQSTLCHELMHLVLWIEGYPAFVLNHPFGYASWRDQILSMLCNLVLHIEVWSLTKEYGFPENQDYDLPHIKLLIPQILNNSLFFDPPNHLLRHPGCAAYLAQSLLSPTSPEIKNQIRKAAKQTMPEALLTAESICQVFDKYFPLTPQAAEKALLDIFDILEVPKEILQTFYPEKTCPDFRSRIFS